jgi:hypothetical protein
MIFLLLNALTLRCAHGHGLVYITFEPVKKTLSLGRVPKFEVSQLRMSGPFK